MGKTGINGNTERRKGTVLLDTFTGVPNPEFGGFFGSLPLEQGWLVSRAPAGIAIALRSMQSPILGRRAESREREVPALGSIIPDSPAVTGSSASSAFGQNPSWEES